MFSASPDAVSPPGAWVAGRHESFDAKGWEMDGLLLLLGRIAGVAGLALCVVAAVTRLGGAYYLGGFELATLLQAGVAVVVVGCFLLFLVLTARSLPARE